MATGLKLIRRPDTKRIQAAIKSEIRYAYTTILYPAVIARYAVLADFGKWKRKPIIKFKYNITRSKIYIKCYVDMRYNPNMAFIYQDKGTGLDGPRHSTYPIVAKDAPMLQFDVPYHPITVPYAAMRYSSSTAPRWVKTRVVDHPGIQRRDYTMVLLKWLVPTSNAKGLHSVTKRAYERAFAYA